MSLFSFVKFPGAKCTVHRTSQQGCAGSIGLMHFRLNASTFPHIPYGRRKISVITIALDISLWFAAADAATTTGASVVQTTTLSIDKILHAVLTAAGFDCIS